MLLSIPVCNIDCRTVKNEYSLLRDQHFLGIMANVNKANEIFPVGIMIGQLLPGQVTKQLIQDLDCSIALNKGVCLGSALWDMAIEID